MKYTPKTKVLCLIIATSASLIATGCTNHKSMSGQSPGKIKNVIVMIGDGMGPQQIGLLDSYVRYANNPTISSHAFQRLSDNGVIGVARTEADNVLVVDSAASATQFASGSMAGAEMIGADKNGDATTSMLEIAKEKGKAVGLVSDTRMTHATPAAFAAHQQHRSLENEIAEEMLSTDADVMLSGGIRHWLPESVNDKESASYKSLTELTKGAVRLKSKRSDEKNLLITAQQQGYELSFDRNQLQANNSDKLLGLYSYSGMLDGIAYTNSKNDPARSQPSLVEMTDKALSVLEKDEDGFFLMVEGGQIDWAAHDNDAATVLHEMIKFSESIDSVLKWMEGRDDTLLIVSADHETGGFGFAYSRNDLPAGSPLQGNVFNGDDFKPQWNFGQLDTLDKIYQQKVSYNTLFVMFDKLDESQQTATNLQKLVNENTEFPITLDEAKRVLQTENNNYYVEGHGYLESKTFPLFNEREEFFVYGSEMRKNLLAVVTAKYSNIIWGTDNHTSTPVYVFAYGPNNVTQQFGTLQHSTDWANKVINSMK